MSGSILAGYPVIPRSGCAVVGEPLPELATGQHAPVALWPSWPLRYLCCPFCGTSQRVSSASVHSSMFCSTSPVEGSLTGPLAGAAALLRGAFLPEGSVLWPVLGGRVRWWVVWSPFLQSHRLETSHTFLGMPRPCQHPSLVPGRPGSCPGSRRLAAKSPGTGLRYLYQDGTSQVMGGGTGSVSSPLSSFTFCPSRSSPSVST